MDEDGESTEITSVLLSISVLNAIVLGTKKSLPLLSVLNKKAGFPFGSPAVIWFEFVYCFAGAGVVTAVPFITTFSRVAVLNLLTS